MLYQSTGEVRAPRKGEYYLSKGPARRLVALADGDWPNDWRIIMEPSQASFNHSLPSVIMEPVGEFVEPELERARRAHGD